MTEFDSLKDREIEILRLMSQGLTNREIAERLYIGVETVRWYAKQIYSKLHVEGREEAVEKAAAWGLLDETHADIQPKHNLPTQLTAFIGREQQIADILQLFNETRLLTLTGPGGVGKTRLALEVAGKALTPGPSPKGRGEMVGFDNGVYFVELAPLSDPANIVVAIADAIGYQLLADKREPTQQLLDFLGNKRMLLVMDNYEHLLGGASLVTDVLKAAPSVKVLATSRQRLNLSGETIFNLEGMDFPTWETPADALDYPAMQLCMQAAQRTQPDFELTQDNIDAIARICKLVEGMPLGILLAAAWLSMLSPAEIAAEIAKSIDFLASDMGDMPERQRSMRAVFDHSWNLMSADEQQVFMRLSVFRGGFTREAAEAVTGASLRILMSLMNKSLISRDGSSGRYDIHELLRQYAGEKLSVAGASEDTLDTHTRCFAELLQQLEPTLKGSNAMAALAPIEADLDNIYAAWHRVCVFKRTVEIKQMLESLNIFYMMRGRHFDGASNTGLALEYIGDQENTVTARLYWSQSRHKISLIDFNETRAAIVHGLALWRTHGVPGEATFELGLITTFIQSLSQENMDEFQQLFERNLAACKDNNDTWGQGWSLFSMGSLALDQEDYDRAEPPSRASVSIFRELGNHWAATFALGVLERLLTHKGNYEEARQILHTMRATCMAMGDGIGLVWISWRRADIAYAEGLNREVEIYVCETLRLAFNLHLYLFLGYLSPLIGYLLESKRDVESAVAIASRIDTFLDSNYLPVVKQLQDFKATVAPDVFAAAEQRGKSLDLDTVIQELLAEFKGDADGNW